MKWNGETERAFKAAARDGCKTLSDLLNWLRQHPQQQPQTDDEMDELIAQFERVFPRG